MCDVQHMVNGVNIHEISSSYRLNQLIGLQTIALSLSLFPTQMQMSCLAFNFSHAFYLNDLKCSSNWNLNRYDCAIWEYLSQNEMVNWYAIQAKLVPCWGVGEEPNWDKHYILIKSWNWMMEFFLVRLSKSI